MDFSKSVMWKWLILGFCAGFGLGAIMGFAYNVPYALQSISTDDCYSYCTLKNSTPLYELVNNKENACFCDKRIMNVSVKFRK